MHGQASHSRQSTTARRGFTIVELLIVVVVIAILATITIVAYNGITQRAKESSLLTDLRNNAKIVEVKRTTDGTYPADATSAGLVSSTGNSVTYATTRNGFCIVANNSSLSYSTTQSGTVQKSPCSTARVVKGSSVACAPSTCNYVSLTVSNFPTGTYQIRCRENNAPWSSYQSYTVPTNGIIQLSCWTGSAGASIDAEINGWGLSDALVW